MNTLFRKYLFLFVIILLVNNVLAQQITKEKLVPFADTIQIDSLTLIPGTVKVSVDNLLTDTSFYQINYTYSILIFKKTPTSNPKFVLISYRTFPFNLSQPYFHRDSKNAFDSLSPVAYRTQKVKPNESTMDILGLDDFQKSGSISRGITSGNSQNLSVSSDMNIQLSGKLTPDLQLTAVISDNNIPIQPEGNTQQLQDFDQIFVRLEHQNFNVTAGDFVNSLSGTTFLQYSRKSQGLIGKIIIPGQKPDKKLESYGSASIARGNYNRFQFQGIEGNQGPYKLQGANNERYIVVLSGTERVYMDGQLLVRGENQDYIIDYNTAEILFMPRILVTKDKRFVVEFEYSEQNYSRAVLSGGMKYTTAKGFVRFDAFSQMDLKAQPIEPLSEEAKKFLAGLGDDIESALFPSIDSVPYDENRIMYRMIDSLGYDSVLVFSTNPTLAKYQAVFSLVGSNKGDYILISTLTNGRVYQWIEPKNGIPQGNYAPVRVLISPKRNQVLSAAFEYSLTKNIKAKSEIAWSVRDLNSFSSVDDADNHGFALSTGISGFKNLTKKPNSWIMKTGINYQFIDRAFVPVERIRPVEFGREWSGLTDINGMDEHLGSFQIIITNPKKTTLDLKADKIYKSSMYQGVKSDIKLNITPKKYHFNGRFLYSSNQLDSIKSNFTSHYANISRSFDKLVFGIGEFSESRTDKYSLTNQFLGSSFQFIELKSFIVSGDSSKVNFKAEYKRRFDYYTDSMRFRLLTDAHDITAEMTFAPTKQQQIKFIATYRNLGIADTAKTSIKPENTALIRFDYRLNALKGLLRVNSFYETSNGLELKKEYSYIQVADGQGVYSWTDYNNNGIKELDEFDISPFPDQANYIRIILPTNNFVKAYGSRFSLTLNFLPPLKWKTSSSQAQRFTSRFSDNLVFNSQLKTSSSNLLTQINPFIYDLEDSNLVYVNTFFRNSLFFNRNSSIFSVEWTFVYNMNKMLMMNGFEGRSQSRNELKLRNNISKQLMLETEAATGNKKSFAEAFASRNYSIDFKDVAAVMSFQPNQLYRLALRYNFADKRNRLADHKAQQNEVEFSFKVNNPKKGSLTGLAALSRWTYNKEANDALSFEMLEGYKAGINFRWNIGYNRTLFNNLQLTLIYDGRKPSELKIIHTGTVQIRAFL